MSTMDEQLPRPTLPGKVQGIVGWDPIELQCSDCGAVHTGDGKLSRATEIILAGYLFHVCEGRTGLRRCPSCLAKVKADCPRSHL